jgi:hypothetical protein
MTAKPRHGNRLIQVPDSLRDLFDGTEFSRMGKVMADVVDAKYDCNAPGPYNELLRRIFILMKRAAVYNCLPKDN